ncbi:helicase DnaB [Synechococcus sp. CCY9202]|uniref:helicase DnaB n=1 Tax=Synechococcus sp. CCY9202 TaxID=174698 RepID=UPI003A4C75E8
MLLATALGGVGEAQHPLESLINVPDQSSTISGDSRAAVGSVTEGQRVNPIDFTPEELRELQKRFGVHGPQPRLAQLLTEGLDQLEPLRSHTLTRLEELRPVILSESLRRRVNPMLVAAVLFDEMQHAKPGESHPIAAHSGLFSTLGPAQLGLGEMVHQGLLPADATPEQLEAARDALLDPEQNVTLLVGKFERLQKELELTTPLPPIASRSPHEAKALATLAYLHNGKLDYPARVLRYMQDPELHALLYGNRRKQLPPLI